MYRLRRSTAQRECELTNLQLWAISTGASRWIVDAEAYEWCRLAGIVSLIRLDPAERTLELVISDGTGCILSRWNVDQPGVRTLSGTSGKGLVLEGLVTRVDGLVMHEPSFRTVAYPVTG